MLRDPIERHTLLRNLAVPLTAHAAFGEVWPVIRQSDPDARLVLVMSGEDIDAAGEAEVWQFYFDLPRRQAQATLGVGRLDDPEDYGSPRPMLVEQIRPFVPPGDLWELMREGEAAMRRYTAEQWQKQLAGRPPLPIPFYDSSRAVAALSAQGVVFGVRGQGRYLSGKVRVTGEAVWAVSVGEEVYTTPFAAPALPPGP